MEIDNQVQVTIERLNSLSSVKSADDYIQAGDLWKAGKLTIKVIEDKFNDDIDFAHREHKRLIAEKKKYLGPIEEAVKRIKRMMADYDLEMEQKQKQEQAKLEAEARKREEERRLAEAVAVEQAGDRDAADRLLNEEITLPPVSVQKDVPKVEGVVLREIWKFQITDPEAIPREYLMPDEKKIGQVVRAMKGAAKIPGIKVYSEKV